jgi:hypothetical protein
LILYSGIAGHGDDGLSGAALLGKTDCARHVDAGGKTGQQTLLAQQLIHNGQRRLVLNAVSAIHDRTTAPYGWEHAVGIFGLRSFKCMDVPPVPTDATNAVT